MSVEGGVGLERGPGQAACTGSPQQEESRGAGGSELKQETGGCSVNQGRYLP